MITNQIKIARYSKLTNRRLQNLAAAGVASLRITEGSVAEIQAQSLANAYKGFKTGEINVNNYRRRLRMVLNHCRIKVETAWGNSPEMKPTIADFMRKCKQAQDG